MSKIDDYIRLVMAAIEENNSLPPEKRDNHSCTVIQQGRNTLIVSGPAHEMRDIVREFLKARPEFRSVIRDEMDKLYKIEGF